MSTLLLESEFKNYFRGLRRVRTTQINEGAGPCKVGRKDPLSFDMYQFLSLQMLKQENRKYIFARTFLILCWNLMSRAGNAFSICYSHIEYSGDALQVYFAHMKNDQMGERPRDPRHVYANPIKPRNLSHPRARSLLAMLPH